MRANIVHLDMDSFYVSVERLRDPSLLGKPVVVGGDPSGRGVVASASYEARRFGVRSAMPAAQAKQLCPQAVWVFGDYESYAPISRRLKEIFGEFTPLVEMASQDEAYLDLEGTERLWGPSHVAADRLRQRVMEDTKLPCSVGISSSKIISKIASGMCKPQGLLWVPAGSELCFLSPLAVGLMPGVGPVTEKFLQERGLLRLGDLVSFGEAKLAKLLGEHGSDLFRRAQGLPGRGVQTNIDAKSIGNETTFDHDSASEEFLLGVVMALCEQVGSRMRHEGVRGTVISVKYRYGTSVSMKFDSSSRPFETHTAATTLPVPTWDDGVLYQAAKTLLLERWERSRGLRLLGVTARGLVEDAWQLDLLGGETNERRDRLHDAIDAVRGKHGYTSIRRVSSRDERGGKWGGKGNSGR